MVSKCNHLLYHFQSQFIATLPVLLNKIVLKKKSARKMLIEEIINFELRGPGPPGRTCTPTAGYFYDKTKIS